MAETVKFRKSVHQSRKPKRFEPNKYKDYLFGPIDAFDMEWANTVLEYNPGLKLDTKGLNKYCGNNTSISTDGSLHTGLLGNTDTDFYEPKGPLISDSLEDGLPVVNSSLSKPPLDTSAGSGSIDSEKYKDDIKRLETERDELRQELDKVNLERENDKRDAGLYREFQKQIRLLETSVSDKMDIREKLEQTIGRIYTLFCESFGADNPLSLTLEEFANLYLKQQSDTQVELASLRSQLKIVNNLDKIINEKNNYEELIQQKVKTIDLLVDQLKTTKSESLEEITRLKDELRDTQTNFDRKLSTVESMCREYEIENQTIYDLLTSTREGFNKLLHDQHELISQLPLATMKNCSGEHAKDYHGEIQLRSVDGKNVLESLVQDLYRRNEDSLAIIYQKDCTIQRLYGMISKLQRNLKEWEHDAILWLDYVEHTEKPNGKVN